MLTLPTALLPLIVEFAPLFSKPVWEHATVLLIGADTPLKIPVFIGRGELQTPLKIPVFIGRGELQTHEGFS
jgi:hypothetical protein